MAGIVPTSNGFTPSATNQHDLAAHAALEQLTAQPDSTDAAWLAGVQQALTWVLGGGNSPQIDALIARHNATVPPLTAP